MKTFSDIVNHMNLNNHNITIAQVRKTVTSWGKRNTLVRSVVKYQVWLDSNDNNDRVVISGEVILNNKKTGPEKGVDMPMEIHHYSDFDTVKRTFTKSHPEQYFRIDGLENPADVKSMYQSLGKVIEGMVINESFRVPGMTEYLPA
ncbi:hypothetical protein ACLI07_23680 (plasmid) [Providencia huaxiensis]|uniref:Uncharacterized protein n=4 Tax=Morganellaceae TaxID=1903414 RepID=Q8KK58_PROVU|nr:MULTISPECIES: hypothetical protein [Enterobacterales]ELB1214761.1 hypothetical protein [Proteus mirabilis]ELY4881584.1 hypothetical protein [Morganella morganii]SPY66761.1 Uncharacterised protein [Providencia stuartii]HAZ7869409.1 hypothetical protein [Escherichia coli]ELR5094203.1 hypothetical protein [Providencia rettgeri]